MYLLNHKFQVVKETDIIIIKNSITNKSIVTFKDKGIDFEKFRQLIYYGQYKDMEYSLEFAELNQLVKAFPASFTFCSESKMNSLFAIIRQYTEFLLSSFISADRLESYLNYVEEIINEKKACDVYFSLDSSLPFLSEMLSKIPFLNITNEKDDIAKKKYDITITEVKKYEYEELLLEKSEDILFLNLNHSSIEIGPLVFASKFKIPNMKFDLDNSDTNVLKHEESLLYFFLEKILYIYFFNLYDKINTIDFFPSRSRICIDRRSLQGHGELVPMYPKCFTT